MNETLNNMTKQCDIFDKINWFGLTQYINIIKHYFIIIDNFVVKMPAQKVVPPKPEGLRKK